MHSPLTGKRAIVCDLDGTLAQSKAPIDEEMARLISSLLSRYYFAVLGGGNASLFFSQVVRPLERIGETHFTKLGLFPTSGSRGFRYEKEEWKEWYAELLPPTEVSRVRSAFEIAFSETSYQHPEKVCGEIIENRETAVVFSALGQEASLQEKERWHRMNDHRPALQSVLQRLLPDCEVKIGGLTSIDVTRRGIDKAYGIEKIKELFALKTHELIFIGDALFPGGNDEPVKRSGVETLSVSSPEETKEIFRKWIQKSDYV